MYRTWHAHVVFLAVFVLGGCSSRSGPSFSVSEENRVNLSGAGSTFVKPLMDKWVAEYTKLRGGEINYQGLGSGAGVKQMTERKVDFGCTDAFMTRKQLEDAEKEGGAVIHVPLAMGGIVPAYHLPGVKADLNFTGEVLAEIYLGHIKTWNDPKIRELNPDAELPNLTVKPIHRADKSGSTAIFTEFLAKTHKEWGEAVNHGTEVSWPQGVGNGEQANAGVAGAVLKNEGAIGYIELFYALQNKIQFGAVRNAAGKFVKASLETATRAAQGKKDIPEDLRFTLIGAEGEDAYPISGTVWAVLYVQQGGDTGKQLVDFFTWATHDGQEFAKGMEYAPLPASLVTRIEEKLKKVQ
jgi:phosphate transport system substrate-binding protein